MENGITQATRLRKVILPVQLEPVALKPGMEYSLRRIHWHDAQQGLTDWALESLLERIERHLEQGKQVPNVDIVMQLTNRAMTGDKGRAVCTPPEILIVVGKEVKLSFIMAIIRAIDNDGSFVSATVE